MFFSSDESLVRLLIVVSGAVGGQPDVLSSVDVTAQRHTAADIQRHSADADSSLLLPQNPPSPSSTVRTVVTVESADKSTAACNGLESSDTAAIAADTSVLQQPAESLPVPIRYLIYIILPLIHHFTIYIYHIFWNLLCMNEER